MRTLLAISFFGVQTFGFAPPFRHTQRLRRTLDRPAAVLRGDEDGGDKVSRARETIRRFEELSAQLGSEGMDAEGTQACLDELELVEARIDAGGMWEQDLGEENEGDQEDGEGGGNNSPSAPAEKKNVQEELTYEEAVDLGTLEAGGQSLNSEFGSTLSSTAAATGGGEGAGLFPDYGEGGGVGGDLGLEEAPLRDERSNGLFERALRFYDPRYTQQRERCYLVGLEVTSGRNLKKDFSLEESLNELSELAGTAGLEVSSRRLSVTITTTTKERRQWIQDERRLARSNIIVF